MCSPPPLSNTLKISKPSLRVVSSPSSTSSGQDLPWTRLPPQQPQRFKPSALFLPHSGSRLRLFNQKVYSHLPLLASSLLQPTRQPQVSHCCYATTDCIYPEVPRASRSFPNPRLSKDLNASRRSEPRLQRELLQQVPDLIHAHREAGHPYKYTTKDVRAILRYVNDKPEPARPSFFTEAD